MIELEIFSFSYYGKNNNAMNAYKDLNDPLSLREEFKYNNNKCEECERRKSVEHKEWDSEVDDVLRMYYNNIADGRGEERSLLYALHSHRMWNSMDFEKSSYITSQATKRIQNQGEK